MPANQSMYIGALIQYNDSLVSGNNYQSGGTYAGSGWAQWDVSVGRLASLIHISGTPSKWGNGTATAGVPNLNAFSVLQSALDVAHTRGALPMVDWSPWDWALPTSNFPLRPAAVTAGTWDTYITTWATACKAWGKPVLLRPMWEQNGTQFPWAHTSSGSWNIPAGNGWGGTWTNAVADYIQAWQHIVNIFKNVVGCFNARFFWCPNRLSTAEKATLSYAQMFPGAGYVDWFGADSYSTQPSETVGNAFRGTGTLNFLTDIYADITALDPKLPFAIGETGIFGPVTGSASVSNIVANGSTWTITVSGNPAGGSWAATQGIEITGVTPSGYNGVWTIASGTSPTLVVNNSTSPGALSVAGTGRLIDRITRATSIKTTFETDLPAMPRCTALAWYWVQDGSRYPFDVDGTAANVNNVDLVAYRNALNSHYLKGQEMATDTSSKVWVPYQDQSVGAGFERYLGTLRSTPGLEGLWPLTDAHGLASVADISGNARNGTVNGTTNLGATGIMPSQPGWTSVSFPGVATSNISTADNNAWSPVTTGTLTLETTILLASTPVGNAEFIGKANTGQGEYALYATATSLVFQTWQLSFASHSDCTITLPSILVPHHIVAVINLAATNPVTLYVDGSPHIGTGASGSMSNGTSVLMFGASPDGTNPVPSGSTMGVTAVFNTACSAETVAEHYAAWIASPVISAVTAN